MRTGRITRRSLAGVLASGAVAVAQAPAVSAGSLQGTPPAATAEQEAAVALERNAAALGPAVADPQADPAFRFVP